MITLKNIQKIFTLFILLIISFSAWGQTVSFKEANKLYEENKFKEAISVYEQLLENDKHAASIYYNLGNAHFKNGDLASAILNYERAYRLNPTDKDIRSNLQYAKAQRVDNIEIPNKFFVSKWYDSIIESFNSNIWAYIGIFFWILLFLMLVLFLNTYSEQKRKTFFTIGLISLIFTVSSFHASYKQYSKNVNEPHAIVFSESITVKSTPSNNGTDLFILHPGTKVKLLDKVGKWHEIRLADGREGWLPSKDITKI